MILSIIFSCGCADPAPDRSTVRTSLIFDIFELTKRKNYKDAVVKIRKLRDLDKTNSFLPELESVTIANQNLQEVDRLLQQNQREAATIKLHQVIRDRGISRGKSPSAEKMKDMLRMEYLVDQILDPKPQFNTKVHGRYLPASQVTANSIAEFLQLSKKWNVPLHIQNKVAQRSKKIPQLRKFEAAHSNLSLKLFANSVDSLVHSLYPKEVRDYSDHNSYTQTFYALTAISDGTKE